MSRFVLQTPILIGADMGREALDLPAGHDWSACRHDLAVLPCAIPIWSSAGFGIHRPLWAGHHQGNNTYYHELSRRLQDLLD